MGELAKIFNQAMSGSGDESRDHAWRELLDVLLCYARATMSPEDRAQLESADLAGSVAASFLGALRSGRVRFRSEGELRAYLKSMVHNKLHHHYRKMRAQRRGAGRPLAPIGPARADGELDPPGSDDSASAKLMRRELEASLDERLDPGQRRLVELVAASAGWQTIGDELGVSAEAARMRFQRLRSRLGLDAST